MFNSQTLLRTIRISLVSIKVFRVIGIGDWYITTPAIMKVNTTLDATMNVDSHGQTATAFTFTVPAIIAVLALVCLRLWPFGLDPREPRLIPSNIPFIGHAIGMLRYQQRYFEMLRYDYCVDMTIPASHFMLLVSKHGPFYHSVRP